MNLTKEAVQILEQVTTATLTTVLLKKGLRNTWIRGAQPLTSGLPRVLGPAFTLRFIPPREDLATPESWKSPTSTRGAIEAMPEGCVAVIDAFGTTTAGIWGDILCERMVYRGIKGLVTDGVIRDRAGVVASKLPVWSQGAAASPSVAGLTFTEWQTPIGCGGVAVFPNDIIVADQDGAVVIPHHLLEHVLEVAPEQEALEGWVIEEVRSGKALPGLYPANEENQKRYQEYRNNKK